MGNIQQKAFYLRSEEFHKVECIENEIFRRSTYDFAIKNVR